MWNIKYVWIYRNGTFFLTCIISDKQHFFDKIPRIENIIDAKKKTRIFPLFAVPIFFSPPFSFFFFQYSCSFIRMKFEYISFSTLLKQYRLFIFHLSRYKNLIHIISFFFLAFSFYHAMERNERLFNA